MIPDNALGYMTKPMDPRHYPRFKYKYLAILFLKTHFRIWRIYQDAGYGHIPKGILQNYIIAIGLPLMRHPRTLEARSYLSSRHIMGVGWIADKSSSTHSHYHGLCDVLNPTLNPTQYQAQASQDHFQPRPTPSDHS